ncbi:MAG: endonuclease/exonuclease/phosphatase family protein [Polyangiaceae bacterium]
MRLPSALWFMCALWLAPACGDSAAPAGGGGGGNSDASSTGGSNDASTGGTAAGGSSGSGGQGGGSGVSGGSAGSDASAGSGGSDAGADADAQSDATAGSGGADASFDAIADAAGGSSGDAAASGGTAGSDAGTAGTGGLFDCPIASDAGSSGDAGTDAGSVRVRVMAANITSDNFQAYEPPGIRILQALKPDIALLQEMNYRHGTLRAFVDTAFGSSFCYFREPQPGGIPNGIVSRYPIVASGEWQDAAVSDRDFAWARIDVPGPVDLWAVSVHLKSGSVSTRAAQVQALLGYVQAQVPAGDYVVVGGDLNTESNTENAINLLAASFVTGAPHPADQNANENTNTNRNKPYDWVLPSPAFNAHSITVTQGASSYPAGLVFDSRVYTPLSEVVPVQFGDSGVSGMQHMAVVRDFALP